MKSTTYFLILLIAIGLTHACKQKKSVVSDQKVKVETASVAFYNLENLFDTIDQPDVDDAEFLSNGSYKWDRHKYKSKLHNMSFAISKIGIETTPAGVAILGVSEIENRIVLEDLVKEPEIANRAYQIVHYDGIDRRGVDVGLLYNPKLFVVSNSKSYRLHTDDPEFRTRDQLMVSGYLMNEKIHVIVNHWPSRYGGDASNPKRVAAATLTRSITDSLLKKDPKARIIIMGDLNDDPTNESCMKVLRAKKEVSEMKEGDLFNTLWKTWESGVGSLAYNDQWNLFDQHIISSELVNGDRTKLKYWKAEIFNKPFLTQQEGRYKGTPLRTHSGGAWTNGYSDHYPTLIYLIKEKQ